MQSRWKHFKAGCERFSLGERLLLAAFVLSLITVWLVGPRAEKVNGYRWHFPMGHSINYYTK